jgi:peptide/nickel transport system permease protein
MKRATKYLKRWQTLLALIIVSLFIILAIFAPVIASEGEMMSGELKRVGSEVDSAPHPPSQENPLGTLPRQLDVFYGLVRGTRSAVSFGLAATLLTALIGLLVGGISGLAGGKVETWLMRFTDAFLCIPTIAAVALIEQLLEIIQLYLTKNTDFFLITIGLVPRSIFDTPLGRFVASLNPVMLALIVFSWMAYARTFNTLVSTLRQVEYVQAARAVGADPRRIFFRHILPNSVSPIIILAAKDISSMVMLQTTFTFIGFQGRSAWAQVLVAGRDWIIGLSGNPFTYWWVWLPVTLTIILFGVGWNLLGDEINHWMNPKRDYDYEKPNG